jgi:MTH538 TIR-like domain (DUF1863)
MINGLFGLAARDLQIKRKVFVSYHHGGDRGYYEQFSRAFCDTYDVIDDNSVDRAIDSDDVEYVTRRLRENFITGNSCTFVLVGLATWGRKFVEWEIKATLDKEHGLMGVRLPTAWVYQGSVAMPDRREDNIKTGYAIWVNWHELIASPQLCAALIEQANARGKWRIDNTRERRLRNA